MLRNESVQKIERENFKGNSILNTYETLAPRLTVISSKRGIVQLPLAEQTLLLPNIKILLKFYFHTPDGKNKPQHKPRCLHQQIHAIL